MNKKTLYTLWGALFILCAGLGFIPVSSGAVRFLLTAVSLIFFVPPALILWQAAKKKDLNSIRLVRDLSIASLGATTAGIILNILSAMWPVMAGNILHIVLTIVSSPMMACGSWVLSMFLWACLLMVSLQQLRTLK